MKGLSKLFLRGNSKKTSGTVTSSSNVEEMTPRINVVNLESISVEKDSSKPSTNNSDNKNKGDSISDSNNTTGVVFAYPRVNSDVTSAKVKSVHSTEGEQQVTRNIQSGTMSSHRLAGVGGGGLTSVQVQRQESHSDISENDAKEALSGGENDSKLNLLVERDYYFDLKKIDENHCSISEKLLYYILRGDSLESIQKFLESETVPLDVHFELFSRATPLHAAVYKGNHELVEFLLNLPNTCGIDAKDKLERTPLHIAVSMGYQEVCLLLLKYGANLNQKDSYGHTPVFLALKGHHFGLVDDFLIMGGEINIKKHNGRTALHDSAASGDLQVIDYLVSVAKTKTKVLMNLKDSKGETPLHTAVAADQVEALKAFLKISSVDMFAINDNGRNFIHIAIQHGSLKVLAFLKGSMMPVSTLLLNLQDSTKKRWTPLHLAVSKNNIHLVKALVDLKVNPNIQDFDGNTPLHLALISRTSSPEVTSTFDYVTQRDILNSLKSAGAKLDIKNKIGIKPSKLITDLKIK